ncbi:unnamed protein product, partial [Rotaria socialis]
SAAPAISGITVGPVYTSASIPLAMNTTGAANAPSSIASPSIGLSNRMTSGQLSSTLQPYINSMNPATSRTTVLPVNTPVLLKTVTSGVSEDSAAPAISGSPVGPVYTSASIPLAMNTIGAA